VRESVYLNMKSEKQKNRFVVTDSYGNLLNIHWFDAWRGYRKWKTVLKNEKVTIIKYTDPKQIDAGKYQKPYV
jgi:hypothetical protein